MFNLQFFASDRIVLGSGKLYCAVYSSTTGIPDDETIEDENNLIGWIQGGATLSYTPSFYETEDDLGMVKKKMLTKEEASLKTGVMTWNGKTLEKLCATARVTEDTSKHTRTVKIGGIGEYTGAKYILRFVHEDDVDGNIRTTIVGANESGFSLAFQKDKETVIDAEFKAFPNIDTEGTLILYQEEDSTITA